MDREKRFNLSRTIPKIAAETTGQFLEEIDNFEREYARTTPAGIKDWVLALEDALTGRAKAWRDLVILTNPGKELYEATLRPNPSPNDFGDYYRYIRSELFHRCGLEYEMPGEGTKRKWKAI